MNSKQFQKQVVSLSDRLFPMAVRLLGNQADAQDAIQEIMIRLWNKRKQIAKHPNIPGLVFLTTRNYCLDLLRKRTPHFDDSGEEINLPSPSPEMSTLEQKELNSIIRSIIQQLPEQQQKVIIMYDLDGLEYVEIAEITQLKIDHIRVLLSRARKTVGTALKKTSYYE